MIIEVLDTQGDVITQVANSGNPDRDTAAYGGTSWRLYVEPAAVTLERNRAAKITETRQHAMSLIGALVPALAKPDSLDLIVELLQANMLSAPAPGSDMEKVKNIYVYAKGKISQARTATQTQLDAYDPVTDPDWPT